MAGGAYGLQVPVLTCAATARSNVVDDWTFTAPTYGGGGDNENRDSSLQAQRVSVFPAWRTFDQGCPYIVSVSVTFAWADTSVHITTKTFSWTAAQALTPRVYGQTANPGKVCQSLNSTDRLPSCDAAIQALDHSIVCTIVASDPAQWFAGLGAFAGCLFTPEGWDRSQKLTTEWQGGGPGQLVSAFRAALPDSIGCGAVGTITLYDKPVVLDTCNADIAPSWAKVVIGWLLVLGLGALAVRRLLWTVGSSS